MNETELNVGSQPSESGVVRRGGQTLAGRIRQHGALPERELAAIFLQVLADLELAHSQAMLHRDISPTRVAFEGGTWKLIDYGIARVGTVRYMSPERCQGKTMDSRSDTYSLGAVLFEAATGRPPFDAEMKHEIINAQINKAPPAPRSINPSISPDLERVILRALSKNPAGRYQTAGEFKRAMESVARLAKAGPAVSHPDADEAESERSAVASGRAHVRVKPAVVIVPIAVVVVGVIAYFLLAGGVSAKMPLITGMARDDAEQALKSKGLAADFENADDTMPVGTVTAQIPAAGDKIPGSKHVKVLVSTGLVGAPIVSGLSLAEAQERLRQAGLEPAKVDSQYSDNFQFGTVMGSSLKPNSRVAPHTNVNLLVASGRATCPQCGTKREPGARFCTKCGYKF